MECARARHETPLTAAACERTRRPFGSCWPVGGAMVDNARRGERATARRSA